MHHKRTRKQGGSHTYKKMDVWWRDALFNFQYSHLLLFDGCIVAPYRPHGLQLGLLGHRPLGQLAEGEVEGVVNDLLSLGKPEG